MDFGRTQQNIERYFTVANQIGSSVIDVENRKVSATVPMELPLDAVIVESVKLGGATSVMSPDLNGKTVDFSAPVQVTVSEFGREQVWTIDVTQTDIAVNIDRVERLDKCSMGICHRRGRQVNRIRVPYVRRRCVDSGSGGMGEPQRR